MFLKNVPMFEEKRRDIKITPCKKDILQGVVQLSKQVTY